ncbi:hypothetical protein Tco_0939991 [Tanacetum coccineum]|uniref:Uncharacterized protein n=1 Tax=Tanacetum coccineum TaxID=301880 RepID=A0ABQ5DPB7_9ASTR
MTGVLPSDTVKNLKLNVNTITLVLSARSYPNEDPQCLTHIYASINTITIHPKQQSDPHDDNPEGNEEEEKFSQEDININCDSKAEEEERERKGNPNTIAYNKEHRNTPQLEWKDITTVGNLGPNRDDEGEVTKFLIKNEEEFFTVPGDGVGVIFDKKKLGSS